MNTTEDALKPTQLVGPEADPTPKARLQLEAASPALDVVAFQERQFLHFGRVANGLARAGVFGSDAAQLLAKIMIGDAIAVHPAIAMQQIHIIDGRTALSAGLMLSLVRSRGWRHTVVKHDNTGCAIEWTSPERVVAGTSAFGVEDANRVKLKVGGKDGTLMDKDNYRNYPSDMFFARAVSRGVRRFCPEIVAGMSAYTPEEIRDIPNETEAVASAIAGATESLRARVTAAAEAGQAPAA